MFFTFVGSVGLTVASVVVGIVGVSVSRQANELASGANKLLDRQARIMEAQLRPKLEVRRDTTGGSEELLVANRGGYLGSPHCKVYTYLAFHLRPAVGHTDRSPDFFLITGYYSVNTLKGQTEGDLYRAAADRAAVRELARRDESLGRIAVPGVGGRPEGALVRWGAETSALTGVVVSYRDALGEDRTRTYMLSRDQAAASEGWDPIRGGVTGSSGVHGQYRTPVFLAPRIPLDRLDAAAIREAYISQYTEFPTKAGKVGAGPTRQGSAAGAPGSTPPKPK